MVSVRCQTFSHSFPDSFVVQWQVLKNHRRSLRLLQDAMLETRRSVLAAPSSLARAELVAHPSRHFFGLNITHDVVRYCHFVVSDARGKAVISEVLYDRHTLPLQQGAVNATAATLQ